MKRPGGTNLSLSTWRSWRRGFDGRPSEKTSRLPAALRGDGLADTSGCLCRREEVAENFGGGLVALGDPVGVRRHGRGRRCVAEPTGDDRYGNAGGEHLRGRGVPQIV